MPCTPEELARLAELGADDKIGESAVSNVLDYEQMGITNPSAAEVRSKMGWLPSLRIQRAVLGDEFTAKVMNRLQLGIQRAYNLETKYYKATNDAASEAFGYNWFQRLIGPSSEQREMLTKALELTDAQGNFKGPRASMPDEIISLARNVRLKVYNEAYKDLGLDPDLFLNMYAPHRRVNPKGSFWDENPSPILETMREYLDPAGIRFVSELERRGVLTEWDMDATRVLRNYIHAGVRAKILAPLIQDLEREFVNPYFDLRIIRSAKDNRYLTLVNDKTAYEAWRGLRDHVLGVPTPLDRQMTMTMKSMGEAFGVKGLEPRHLYNVSQMGTNLFYGGVLGSPLGTRPASLIRHMFRLTNLYSEFGAADTLKGIQEALTPGAWAKFVERGVVTAPLEGLHEQVDLARSAGRVISNITTQSLKVFDASDRMMRVAAAASADSRFDRALSEGFSRGIKGGKDISDHVTSLVRQGQIDKAKDEYAMHIVANTMYTYGKGNRPQIFRGVLGNALGILSSYPLNLSEMYIRLGKRAIRGWTEDRSLEEAMPLIRQIGLATAGMYAGSEFLNSDLSSIFLHGALPESLPGVLTPLHAYEAGRSNVMWGAGNLFLTGETDFHKKQRVENNKAFLRDVSNFVPGGLFFKEVGDVVDNPSMENLLKHMGFNPLANESNAMARERMKVRAQERRLEAFPKIRGIESE